MSTPLRTGLLAAGFAFIFFSIAINSQPHGWLAWYQLSHLGQITQATITRQLPKTHKTCFFKYTVNFREYESSNSGCEAQVGETVPVTYLPIDPTFVSLQPPLEQFAFLVFAPLLMSIFAGIAGAWRTKVRLRSAVPHFNF